MRFHRSRLPAAVLAAVPLLLLGGTTTASAAGPSMTRLPASLAFTQGVTATLTAAGSGALLQDYASSSSSDNAQALPGKSEPMQVALSGGVATCASGPTFVSQVAVYAEAPDWRSVPVGHTVGASVQVSCLTGGMQHKLTWGHDGHPAAAGHRRVSSTACG